MVNRCPGAEGTVRRRLARRRAVRFVLASAVPVISPRRAGGRRRIPGAARVALATAPGAGSPASNP